MSQTQALGITARGLSKAFGARRVISGLDLHVPAGQFVAIVGRSGCGKSTLLRLLTGLETPDDGTLRFGQEEGHASVRLMFQEPRLLPWAKVAANVAVGLGAASETKQAREAALAALQDVGLADRADVWPSTLSGGQKQRVALARALVSRPGLLALDEPLGALDALTRIEMQQLIADVTRRDGFTAVLVTHDVSEAVALADRVLLLEDGAITLDVAVDLPRPRRHGAPEAAAIETRILERVLGQTRTSKTETSKIKTSGELHDPFESAGGRRSRQCPVVSADPRRRPLPRHDPRRPRRHAEISDTGGQGS